MDRRKNIKNWKNRETIKIRKKIYGIGQKGEEDKQIRKKRGTQKYNHFCTTSAQFFACLKDDQKLFNADFKPLKFQY